MAAKFRREGRTIPYTPVADVAAGTMVAFGALIGCADNDIPANTLGALTIAGQYDVQANSGINATAAGTKIGFDFTNQEGIATTGSQSLYTVKAVASGRVEIALNVPG